MRPIFCSITASMTAISSRASIRRSWINSQRDLPNVLERLIGRTQLHEWPRPHVPIKPRERVESNGSKSVEQRVPLVWTRCHFGGQRPWFRCSASIAGRPCGIRAAELYLRDDSIFACRQCCGLAYATQLEIPRRRGLSRARIVWLAIPPFAHGVTSPVLRLLHNPQSCCFRPTTAAYWQPDNAE
jgi:hypothetical protein